MKTTHIVNISGGKDSAACYLLALERGRPFRAVMADTGNENEAATEWVARLHERTGGPQVEVFRADFSRQIDQKRRFVSSKWREQGVPEATIARALAVLVPTGNPFLDLCIWKGRFPSRRAQFCTEWLKRDVMDRQVVAPALTEAGRVVQWIGVRRDESLNRANTPMFRRYSTADGRVLMYSPLIHWRAEACFAIAARHGLPPNPLYQQGMSRVGCFPCINASKAELAQIGRRYPEVIERLAEWEAIVADAAKRGAATFFASDVTPEGAAMGKAAKAAGLSSEASAALPWPRAAEVFEWAKTTRGGRQYDLLGHAEDGLSCSSQYGLCE